MGIFPQKNEYSPILAVDKMYEQAGSFQTNL